MGSCQWYYRSNRVPHADIRVAAKRRRCPQFHSESGVKNYVLHDNLTAKRSHSNNLNKCPCFGSQPEVLQPRISLMLAAAGKKVTSITMRAPWRGPAGQVHQARQIL